MYRVTLGLSPDDLLLLDRGYPPRWLVSLLNQQRLSFCMRVEKAGDGGFACVRTFLRSGLDEQVVTLNAPERRDADDYECPRAPQQVHLVRHVAPNGKVRVLMTNLFDTARFPLYRRACSIYSSTPQANTTFVNIAPKDIEHTFMAISRNRDLPSPRKWK